MHRGATIAIALILACFLFSAVSCGQDQPKPPVGVTYQPDIEFGKGGDVALKLDLARPEKLDGPAPCIVFIHGGGWRGGDRKVHVAQIFEAAKRGYVSATIQYRLVPTAHWPAQVEDVKCAIRHLRANASQYQIDPDRIGACGFSAGAHLSMLLGTMDKADGLEGSGGNPDQSSKVQCVVSFFGPTDLAAKDIPELVVGLVDEFVDAPHDKDGKNRAAASPIKYVDKGDAPMLLFQGTKDRLVPHTQAYVMADAMTKAGLPGRVELLIGADHGWGGADIIRTGTATFDFFAEHLKSKGK